MGLPHSQISDLPPYKPSRLLVGAVMMMSILITVGTAALVGVIISRAHSRQVQAQDQTQAHIPGGLANQEQERQVILSPEDGSVMSQEVRSDGSVVLWLHANMHDQIVVWSPEKAGIVARLVLPHRSTK